MDNEQVIKLRIVHYQLFNEGEIAYFCRKSKGMNERQKILENSKLTAARIQATLMHPVLKTTDYKPREIFHEIKDISDTYFTTGRTVRMVGLAGLRGTGKTTLLWQSADYIFKNYTENIYFFHLGFLRKYDIGVREIHEAIETYLAGSKLWTYKEKIVLLFDEIHEDTNWASDLKILYDLFPVAFVIATGSSALLLQSTADLVTRMLIQHVFPLNFREYLLLNQLDTSEITELRQNLEDILLRSSNAETLFNKLQEIKTDLDNYVQKINPIDEHIYNYIVYYNIIRFLFIDNKLQINSLINDLVRRVLYEDIPKLVEENANPLYAEKILRRLAASDEINIQSLSQSIGISQDKINENLDILVKAELLNVLYPYGGIDSKINKAKKFYFMSPSVRCVILSPLIGTDIDKELYAKMLEDMVVLYLKRIFKQESIVSFSSEKGQKNPDLIIETIDKPILLEIGINKKTTKQISTSKLKYKYGIIINSTVSEAELLDSVVIIPLKYFLLL